jgi:radical SAM superfamily enzyme YgiQ (UPF0313 family)
LPQKRYLLYLINPRRKYRYHWDLKEVCAIMGRTTAIHPLALPTLAALTPDHYDIRILDEEMDPLALDRLALPDMVGITTVVANVKRGYEIADFFRGRGVPVVMGGAQVTFNIEQTLAHADAVVAGEAEGVWPQCLADFERGTFRPDRVYRRDTPYEFVRMPMPRWDLVDTRKVMAVSVQVSRGCPYACDFCLVRNMFGRTQRYRDLDNVVAELAALPRKQISFADDNLTGNKAYSRQLMARLKPLGLSWTCQASIEVAYDEALLADMAQAGCSSILFGIESLNPESLKEGGKHHNSVERYEEAIRRVHTAGISVVGSFVVGFDADGPDAFDHIHDFVVRTGISYVMLNMLTAYPGTDLYTRMKREGRLNEVDPDLINGVYPTMRHRRMSQTELLLKQSTTLERLFDYESLRQRALPVLGNGAFRRPDRGGVSGRDKFLSVVHLVRRYLFTRDRSKRRLFLDLARLGISGRASMPVIVEYLLFISSFHGYLAYNRAHRAEVLAKIRATDEGAWTARESTP